MARATVVIEVRNGEAWVVQAPPWVEVVIEDHDDACTVVREGCHAQNR